MLKLTTHMGKEKSNNLVFCTLRYFWRELLRHKWLALGAIILTPVIVFVRGVLGPLVFADIIGQISGGLPKDQIVPTLLPKALLYLAVFIFSSLVLDKLRLYWSWKLDLLATYDLSDLTFNTLSSQSMQFHNDHFSGSLVSQAGKFVRSFENFFDLIIWEILSLVSYLTFITIILCQIAPFVAVALLLLVAVYTIIAGLVFRKVSALNSQEAKAQIRQTGQLSDIISNILSVKAYAHEKYERKRYSKFRTSTYNAGRELMSATVLRDVAFSLINISIVATLLAVLIFGPSVFNIPVATLVIVIGYTQQLLPSLWSISRIFRESNRIFGDAQAMTKILDTADTVVDIKKAKNFKIQRGEVVFDQVEFRHSDAKNQIFKNFSLKIQPGESVGVVGVSGSGKTTLTKLLLRFSDIDSGKIMIDGQDIQQVAQASLRKSIAYVPQEASLFHRSIAENIAYAKPHASSAEIERAAKLANAHNFIKSLPEGYDTMVGERGTKLSGGQRQRIAIARAILKDAPILVLDEATSALDSESETLIQDALTKLMKNRTSIVIAHRLSTVANLDRIVVLKNGKIVEQGTHEELLRQENGAYKKLWSKQSGAFIEEKNNR